LKLEAGEVERMKETWVGYIIIFMFGELQDLERRARGQGEYLLLASVSDKISCLAIVKLGVFTTAALGPEAITLFTALREHLPYRR